LRYHDLARCTTQEDQHKNPGQFMRIVSNAFWMLLCRIAADLLSFVLFADIARVFGPSGTGEYAYAFAIGNLAALVMASGFDEYGIRQYVLAEPAAREGLWRDLISTQWWRLWLGVALFTLFLLIPEHAAPRVLIVELAVFLIGWGVAHTLFIPAMAAQAMIPTALTDFGSRIAAVGVALALLHLGHASLPVLLVGFPLAGIAMVLIAARNARGHDAPPRIGASGRAMLATSRGTAPFVGSDLLNQLYARTDLLLITYLLGTTQVGLYAMGAKFVEVGVIPLVLFGTAAYPLLSRLAREDRAQFERAAHDVLRLIVLLAAWLAVGIACLIPLVVPRVFGPQFVPAARLLPWFALLALAKGGEIALYRLLYSLHGQTRYVRSLLIGTVVIALLNIALIPRLGIFGAVLAAIASSVVVDGLCVYGLRGQLRPALFMGVALRTLLALALTALLHLGAGRLGAPPWPQAILACAAFPLAGLVLGLVPRPRHSPLLRHAHTSPAPLSSIGVARDG
jgi:O-antigen/teichoic acid export membrane protein